MNKKQINELNRIRGGLIDRALQKTRRLDDDGRWITTENGHHVHISEEGTPDKGNPHVIAAMKRGKGSTAQRLQKLNQIAKETREARSKYLKSSKQEDYSAIANSEKKMGSALSEIEPGTRIMAGDKIFTKEKDGSWTGRAPYWSAEGTRFGNEGVAKHLAGDDEIKIGKEADYKKAKEAYNAEKNQRNANALANEKKSNEQKYKTNTCKGATVPEERLTKRIQDAVWDYDPDGFEQIANGCEAGNVIDAGNVWAECVGGHLFNVYQDGELVSSKASVGKVFQYIGNGEEEPTLYSPRKWYK